MPSRRLLIALTAVTVGLSACTEAAAPAPSEFTWSPFPRTAAPATAAATAEPSTRAAASAKPAASGKPAASSKPAAALPEPGASGAATKTTTYIEEAGFSVELPATWLRVSNTEGPTDAEIAALKKSTGASTSELRKIFETLHSTLPAGIQFYAFRLKDFDAESSFATNMNVLRGPGHDVSLSTYARLAAKQLESFSFVQGPVKHTIVKLPAGSAVKLTWAAAFEVREGEDLAYKVTQYIFIDANDEFVLTLGTKSAPDKATLAEFMAMVKSFRRVKST